MITPEQRDQVPLCGAKKKNGELCRAFAGQGTRHTGTGRCRWHGGNTPSHDKRAITIDLKRRMVTLGEPIEDVTAVSALLSELYASTGHVAWLRQRIADMGEAELGTIEGHAIINLYSAERDRKARIADLCSKAGVDEAAVRIAEVQLNMLGTALARAADTAGLSAPMRQRLGAALREELAAVEANPQALPALTA